MAGSTGAAISNVFTYPLDLIITRLQIQRQLRKDTTSPHNEEYKSIRDAASRIFTNEGGLPGFYTGVVQDTSKTIADSFLFFLAYNFFRQSRLRSKYPSSKHLPVLDELGVGFLAGAFSKALTTPIANIVTRKQTSTMISARSTTTKFAQPDSVRYIASQIRHEKGLQGFWSGYSASLILTLNPSLTFFLYETFKRALLPRSQRDNPPPSTTFLLAAISKAIASSVTYPFSLAKARAQASSRNVSDDSETNASSENKSSGDTLGRPAGRNAARSTVFSIILQIAKTDGISALYEGLGGEVLKGFFSHGITMIVKEAVHGLIIHLYLAVLKLIKRYPNPQRIVRKAQDQAQQIISQTSQQQATNSIKDSVANGMSDSKAMAKVSSVQASAIYDSTIGNVQSAGSSARSIAHDASKHVASIVDDAYDTTLTRARSAAQDISKQVGGSLGHVRDVTMTATEQTLAYATEKTKQSADYLGQKTESLGCSMRSTKNESDGGKQ